MGQSLLDCRGLSSAFRYKILKPLFVNFVLATNVFDMPASMFSRYPRLLRHRAGDADDDLGEGGTREILTGTHDRDRSDDRIHLRRAVT